MALFRASPFKLNMFAQCPQKYKYTYIDGLAKQYAKPKPYLTMGAHVHNALKDFYQKLAPEERVFDQLENFLRKRWHENRKGFKDRADEAKWGVKALQMLRLFVHRMDVTATPLLLEDYYSLRIDDTLELLGRIDRADTLPDGTLHVIDYKTGKYDENDVNETQLLLYSMIVAANTQKPVTKASYLFLQTFTWHTLDVSPDDADKVRAIMTEEVAHIRAEQKFAPRPNKHCRTCDYFSLCPAREHIRILIDEGKI